MESTEPQDPSHHTISGTMSTNIKYMLQANRDSVPSSVALWVGRGGSHLEVGDDPNNMSFGQGTRFGLRHSAARSRGSRRLGFFNSNFPTHVNALSNDT
ncbi:hypothetical protein ACFX2J_004218 [Malus domestica]